MTLLRSIAELKAWRKTHDRIGFVPTMGALHLGHGSLVRQSIKNNPATLVSIFINPTQFNDAEDYNMYPKTLESDLGFLNQVGATAVFYPNAEEIYPQGDDIRVTEKSISSLLEGEYRPGHFDGMLTVVLKLLLLVNPNKAYFGEKDYQQLKLVEKLAQSFFLETEIIGCAIVRDESGLALSSRNTRLSPQGKIKASLIYDLIKRPELSPIEIEDKLKASGFEVDYVADWNGRRLAAAWLENVRLIDNV